MLAIPLCSHKCLFIYFYTLFLLIFLKFFFFLSIISTVRSRNLTFKIWYYINQCDIFLFFFFFLSVLRFFMLNYITYMNNDWGKYLCTEELWQQQQKKKFYSYTEFKIVRISAYHLCISPVRNFSPENKIEWSHSHILWVFFLFFFFYNNIFFFSPRWLILLKPNVSYKNNITSRQH